MRLSVPVAIVLSLAAGMPAFAAPSSSSNNPQLEQRSPLFGPLGLIEDAFKVGKGIYNIVESHKHPNHRRDFLEPRDERVQLLQLRSQVMNYKRAVDYLLELNKRDLEIAAAYDH